MKHSLKITLYLLLLFLTTQIIGLYIVNQYYTTSPSGDLSYKNLPLGIERPEVEDQYSAGVLFGAMIFGTLIFLVLVKYKTVFLWKIWFLLAVFMSMTVAFFPFLKGFAVYVALILSILKIFKPNPLVHNFTEVFIYGGIAAIFAPILSVTSAFILLILISFYDMYAVWKSKHMVKLAEFQKDTKIFAGLYIPYGIKGKNKVNKSNTHIITKSKTNHKAELKLKSNKSNVLEYKVRSALLGGGDVAFSLIFASVILKTHSFAKVLIIPFSVTIALFLLFKYAKKDRYYPAMPFVSIGCFIGYGLLLFFF